MAAKKSRKKSKSKARAKPKTKVKAKTKAKAPAKKSKAKKARKTVRPAKASPAKAKKSKKPVKAPAKKKKQTVGEGDYQASRKFLKEQSDFVKRNKSAIPALGKAAEKALEGPEGDSLREAEATAADRSRDNFDS